MNKRMKDPKGDLRFVHKSTRVYDFWSLKLTAMAYGRQAAADFSRRYSQKRHADFLCFHADLKGKGTLILNPPLSPL